MDNSNQMWVLSTTTDSASLKKQELSCFLFSLKFRKKWQLKIIEHIMKVEFLLPDQLNLQKEVEVPFLLPEEAMLHQFHLIIK